MISTPGVVIREKMEYPKFPNGSEGSSSGDNQVEKKLDNGHGLAFQTPQKQIGEVVPAGPEGNKTFAELGGGPTPWRKTLLGLVLQVAAFQTTAGPIGFLALEHISYPTMVLGKVGRTSQNLHLLRFTVV